MIPEWAHNYLSVFEKQSFDEMPPHREWDHKIELTENAKPWDNVHIIPMTNPETESLDEFLQENLSSGRIRPSKSPWASPFFFVRKKNSKLRPVQDY
jgi:hypothetical protein